MTGSGNDNCFLKFVILYYIFSFIRNELYQRKKDHFEEEVKRQLVGNIVLTRSVTGPFLQ